MKRNFIPGNAPQVKLTTTLNMNTFKEPVVFAVDGRLYLHNLPTGMEVAVYNLNGQFISRFNTQQTNSIALPKGVYLVKAGEYRYKTIVI